MEKQKPNGLQKLHTIILYAFVYVMPLYQKLATLLLVLLVLLSLFKLSKRIDYGDQPYLAPVLLYILVGVSLSYSDVLQFKYLENRASLIAFPLIFLALKINGPIFQRTLKYFVLGCFTAVIVCYLNAFYNSFSWVDQKLVFHPVVNGDFNFFYAVVRDGNYFFSSFFSIFHDTIYFSIFVNTSIAIILSFSLWKKNKGYIFLLFVFTLVIFQLSSKIGIITCFLLFTTYFFEKAKTWRKKIIIPTLIVIIGGVFFLQNPRGKVMIDKFMTNGLFIDTNERFGYTLRLMSWDTAFEVIKENSLLGVGVADAQAVLNQKYAEKGYFKPFEQKLNAHNTFMQIWLECGILGFASVLAMLYYIYSVRPIERNHTLFKTLFLLIIVVSFLFESVLNRFSGIAFFLFFYGLLINRSNYVEKD